MIKLNKINYNIPVILGNSVNALGIGRSFARVNIKCVVIASEKGVANYSNNIISIYFPKLEDNEELYLTKMIDFSKKINKKGYLVATSDKYLSFLVKYQKILIEYFDIPLPDAEVVEMLGKKDSLSEFALKNGILAPKTYSINCLSEIDEVLQKLKFPWIIKPLINDGGFQKELGEKVLYIDEKNFNDKLGCLSNSSYKNKKLQIQEFISGDVTKLYTITSYANRNHDIVAYSVGYKIRQYPMKAGTITSGRVDNCKDFVEIAQNLIKKSKFTGVSNTEFKKNFNNDYYLMEINPRPGLWNYSSTASGVNIMAIAYFDYYNSKNHGAFKPITGTKEIVWVNILLDLKTAIIKRDNKEVSTLREFFKWLGSIRGRKIFAVLDFKDIKPFIYYFFHTVIMITKKKSEKI